MTYGYEFFQDAVSLPIAKVAALSETSHVTNSDLQFSDNSMQHPNAALLAEYFLGRLKTTVRRDTLDHIAECESCQNEVERVVDRIDEVRQRERKGQLRGLIRESRALIMGFFGSEKIVIPRGQIICFDGELNDWRRVAITWKSQRILISRAAWDGCIPCGA